MLYQLSYIGSKTSYQLSVVSFQQGDSGVLLPTFIRLVAIHHVLPVQPRLDRKQRENRERHQPDPLIRERFVRQDAQNRKSHERYHQSLHNKSWCTGKDSNLRTPLGGADLQSAGFNHSPTCAETAKLSLPVGSIRSRQPSYGVYLHAE